MSTNSSLKDWKKRVIEAKEHLPARNYAPLVIAALTQLGHRQLAEESNITGKIHNAVSLRSCNNLAIVAAIELVAEQNL